MSIGHHQAQWEIPYQYERHGKSVNNTLLSYLPLMSLISARCKLLTRFIFNRHLSKAFFAE